MLSVINEGKRLIGFTVLTYKKGHSVKTGPTLFFEEFRNDGYGYLLRTAIENRVRRKGFKKVYCTATISNKRVVNYLLSSGYKIEVQLSKQYGLHDELIFGKFVDESKKRIVKKDSLHSRGGTCRKVDRHDAKNPTLINFIREEFSKDIIKISKKNSEAFIVAGLEEETSYLKKTKRLFIAENRNEVLAAAICLPKRGGAQKIVLLSRTENLKTLAHLLKLIESDAKQKGRKKLYITLPENKRSLHDLLIKNGFLLEGFLEQPYKRNVNVYIYSKFI